jgi:hypothetical protein
MVATMARPAYYVFLLVDFVGRRWVYRLNDSGTVRKSPASFYPVMGEDPLPPARQVGVNKRPNLEKLGDCLLALGDGNRW